MRMPVIGALLCVCAVPAVAQDQLVFNANPKNAFEAGMEAVEGAPGDSTFIHAKVDGDVRRQAAELVSLRPGEALRGKRIRLTTRLKSESVSRSGCSLAAMNGSRSLKSADGQVFSGNTGWQECSVVMVIPDNASGVQLRYYLLGSGKVWSDGFKVEQVGDDVPETKRPNANLTRNGDDR